MKVYCTITSALSLLATVANATTSPISEMALREYHANAAHQSARQKLFKSGHRRPTGKRRIQQGSAMSFTELFQHIKTAQKTVGETRRQMAMFQHMLQITNGYKS